MAGALLNMGITRYHKDALQRRGHASDMTVRFPKRIQDSDGDRSIPGSVCNTTEKSMKKSPGNHGTFGVDIRERNDPIRPHGISPACGWRAMTGESAMRGAVVEQIEDEDQIGLLATTDALLEDEWEAAVPLGFEDDDEDADDDDFVDDEDDLGVGDEDDEDFFDDDDDDAGDDDDVADDEE